MFHADDVMWEKVIVSELLRYECLTDDAYWSQQVHWERRTLWALDRFVPYHSCGC